jgi:YidC/Oxa1 family membrane protein insertase
VSPLRGLLATPARLAPIDLLTAVVLALLALSLVVGPVVAQEGSSAAPSPVASPTAAPSPPLATSGVDVTTAPTATASAEPAGLPSGSNGSADPCDPGAQPTAAPGASPLPHNLCPAQPQGADPISLVAWLFTPIFQVIFLGLAFLYSVTGDIGIAIILLTILIRLLLVPVFRAQIVSQRRMQILQPELRAIQLRYKGNRAKISEEQMKLYRERGVNPASGCLPAIVQLILLLPMYQVFNQGLNAPDISSMLSVFGSPVVSIECQDPTNPYAPCIDPSIPWLAWIPRIEMEPLAFLFPGYPGGLPSNQPEIFWNVLPGLFGLSLLALASAVLQLVQTRMMMTKSDDPQTRTQQRLFLLLPAFSIIYGALLPAGLFIYWITTTVFSIIQQFLINGYGGLFPLFGWTPGFAVNHQPRYPVSMPEPKPQPESPSGTSTTTDPRRSTKESAAGTIRPARRRGRRGRRR